MARPRTKDELLAASTMQFDKLIALVESLPPAAREASFPSVLTDREPEAHWRRDKNCKDVLVHLYEWHQLWLTWINDNLAGKDRPFLPSPYTWSNYAPMNEGFRDKHHATTYGQALELLKKSHEQILARIQPFSDEELFTKKHFAFTGTTSLGSYAVSATSLHYEWACKKIRLYKKALKESTL
ncbi:ClbS/DfsB family four-helix bundle protein [Corynebacterium auriscanis]|uniref:ClbS/DfsB family four-helix bundle protein n=1 Tax=Corynebacterium auriscanis TaxID=99807 RepID=UPI003CF4BB7C